MKKFMVGGAVRDTLMGLEPHDVDFVVVGSTPEEMLAAGFTQVGADFPVFLDESGTEYALARTERKSGRGYNGFVTDHSASVTLEDDLMRRDLTINAMAMDGDTLVDPFGGQDDLKNRVLRHVSPAFADDPVRVLRLARFHARFGHEWTVHPDTISFARQMVHNGELKYLTRERILKELEKALSESYPELFFQTLKECHALNEVIPELDLRDNDFQVAFSYHASAKARFAVLTSFTVNPDDFMRRIGVSTDWFRFATLLHRVLKVDISAHPVDVLRDLKLYNKFTLWQEVFSETPWETFDNGPMIATWLNFALENTRHISFNMLTDIQQKTLKGAEIGEACHQLRKKWYDSAFL